MGDPRQFRSTYAGPSHPWQRDRIQEEKTLAQEFGLKNKTEIWKLSSKLKAFADQAKQLIAATSVQAVKEKNQLMLHLARLGLVQAAAKLDDVLSISVRDIASRRLQTLLVKKGLARTFRQARQYVTHGHIVISDKKIKTPGYLVNIAEEAHITFVPSSNLAKEDHPERTVVAKPKKVRPPRDNRRDYRRRGMRR